MTALPQEKRTRAADDGRVGHTGVARRASPDYHGKLELGEAWITDGGSARVCTAGSDLWGDDDRRALSSDLVGAEAFGAGEAWPYDAITSALVGEVLASFDDARVRPVRIDPTSDTHESGAHDWEEVGKKSPDYSPGKGCV